MVLIPPLRTRRLSLQFRELSIKSAIRMAGFHPHEHEFATTEFLKAVIESASTPTEKHEADPRLWTVQERTLAVCHYLAATADNGEGNFAVGQHGRFLDYVDSGRDYVASADAGLAAGDRWRMVPLTGMAAEAIERLAREAGDIQSGRLHWLIGTMAAQMLRIDQAGQLVDPGMPADDAGLTEWLRDRMQVFAAFPESDFVQMLLARQIGQDKLMHLFAIEPSDDGLVCLPVKGRGEGGQQLPPARFPVGECISGVALELAQSLPKSPA